MNWLKKIQYNSPVILTYALLSLFILLVNYITHGETNAIVFTAFRTSINDPITYVRLFTHVLGHADITHYFNNFLVILLIGPILEEKYGSRNMLFMILITAFVTGVLNMLFFESGILGASGISFMLIILISFVNLQKGKIPITFVLVIFIYLGKEVINGLTMVDNISRITHIVAGICGAAMGFVLNRNTLSPEIEDNNIDT